MAQDRFQTEANPPRNDPPPKAAHSAFSFVLEGIGLFGTLGALGIGAITACSAIGTSMFVPMYLLGMRIGESIWLPGPVAFGFMGAGLGALVGGMLGALIGLLRAVTRPRE